MSGAGLSDEALAELEAKAREAKERADAVIGSDQYKVSYTLVYDDLALLGEEVPDLADATLALIAEVRRLRADAAERTTIGDKLAEAKHRADWAAGEEQRG